MRRHRHPRKATLAIVFVAWGQGFSRYLLLAVLVLSVAAPASLQAQVVGGTLSGSVSDKSDAVVPQAQIVVTNTATGVAHNVTTNADGFYTAPDLLPGPYEVTISAPGFATLARSGITLTVGAKQVLNLTLEVGKTEQA